MTAGGPWPRARRPNVDTPSPTLGCFHPTASTRSGQRNPNSSGGKTAKPGPCTNAPLGHAILVSSGKGQGKQEPFGLSKHRVTVTVPVNRVGCSERKTALAPSLPRVCVLAVLGMATGDVAGDAEAEPARRRRRGQRAVHRGADCGEAPRPPCRRARQGGGRGGEGRREEGGGPQGGGAQGDLPILLL
eukprot:731512-Pyramimonas_sp.AAC.1